MKKIVLITMVFCSSILAVQTVFAQNPIATLEHSGATQVFYGQSSLVDAYNASVNGDLIELSAGYFTAPSSIAKGIQIIGAGHFPDSANVPKRTFILGGLSIGQGADNLQLEGLYINGNINYDGANSINYVKVIRCRLSSAVFNSSSVTASKNNCSFEECFVIGDINFYSYGTNLLITHSVFNGAVYNVNGSALIDGNIFLASNSNFFYSVNSSIIRNNIMLNQEYQVPTASSGNFIYNNLMIVATNDFSYNTASNNYLGVAQGNIFVNQTGNGIDYTQDYHLKNPEKYIGTDGTQVGIYGGTAPFKDKGLPANPQIITKNIASQTDANGNLQVNISVKAQDN